MQTMTDRFNRLESLGFKTPKWTLAKKEQIETVFRNWDNSKESYDTDADGMVISCDSISELEALGTSTDRLKPNGQIALKWQNIETQTVTIKEVEFSQEGGQALTLVARFDPVELSGASISRASLKSYRWVTENNVGIGSVVEIKRSGDVIPMIISVVSNENATPIPYPKTCPFCGAPISVSGANLQCSSFTCIAKEASRINTFLASYDIKGIGYALALEYVRAGITLLDIVSMNFEKIRNSISERGLSLKVWDKVQAQFI